MLARVRRRNWLLAQTSRIRSAQSLDRDQPAQLLSSSPSGPRSASGYVPAPLRAANGKKVLVFALGAANSGIPPDWASEGEAPSINLL